MQTQTTVIARDSLKLDTPAAQEELALLQTLKVGDIRTGVLLPALEIGVQWVCKHAQKDFWQFDGEFFGQPMLKLTIRVDASRLTLDVESR